MNITAGDLKKYFAPFPDSMEINFGSSKFSKRPLIFYRCKVRGENLIQIELSELDDEEDDPEYLNRRTIGFFREYFQDIPDTTDVIFGSTIDGKKLILDSISTVLTFNFDQ